MSSYFNLYHYFLGQKKPFSRHVIPPIQAAGVGKDGHGRQADLGSRKGPRQQDDDLSSPPLRDHQKIGHRQAQKLWPSWGDPWRPWGTEGVWEKFDGDLTGKVVDGMTFLGVGHTKHLRTKENLDV